MMCSRGIGHGTREYPGCQRPEAPHRLATGNRPDSDCRNEARPARSARGNQQGAFTSLGLDACRLLEPPPVTQANGKWKPSRAPQLAFGNKEPSARVISRV